MKIIDQLKKSFNKFFPKAITFAAEKAGYVQKMASLSYNELQCLGMKLAFAIRYM